MNKIDLKNIPNDLRKDAEDEVKLDQIESTADYLTKVTESALILLSELPDIGEKHHIEVKDMALANLMCACMLNVDMEKITNGWEGGYVSEKIPEVLKTMLKLFIDVAPGIMEATIKGRG